MAHDSSNQGDRVEDSDKCTAATLAGALIAAGHTNPSATSTEMAAAQAVEIYRTVLANLQSIEKQASV